MRFNQLDRAARLVLVVCLSLGLCVYIPSAEQGQAVLADDPSPRSAVHPISEAEELAALQAQLAREAVSRARALARHDDPANDENLAGNEQTQNSNVPNRPAADLTVGAGCDYATIAAAIVAAGPGDRLLIEGGRTFTENLTIPISLTLQGGYTGCVSRSAARTTIDGGGVDRVMYIYGNLTVTLENLNITHGNSNGNGAGILALQKTHVGGTNLDISSNTSASYGGGVRLLGASAVFSGTSIGGNRALEGAGVYGTSESGRISTLNLSNAVVYYNRALDDDGLGGGVYMREGKVSLADCSVLNTNTAVEGGGAYLITSTLTIEGDCTRIQSNIATGNGGGIYAQDSTVYINNRARLWDNRADSGGGAYLDNSELWGNMAQILLNTARNFGGGVYATNGSLVDMDLGGSDCLGPRCSWLYRNIATNNYGGGVYASASEVDLSQTFVEYNTGTLGGAIYAWADPSPTTRAVYASNSLFARNSATAGTASGIRLFANAGQVVRMTGNHVTLAYNQPGTAISLDGNGTHGLVLDNSIVWGHTTSINLTGQAVNCSDIQGGYAGAGNLAVDPLFADPDSSNYHLQSTSPAIDQCASGLSKDFDNASRPVDMPPAGDADYDMGADEVTLRVGINGGGCAYYNLRDAIDAASPGDTIQAAADTYFEAVDIDKSLTIDGGYDFATCSVSGAGRATVDSSTIPGSAVDITHSAVTLRNLRITGGNDGGLNVISGGQVVLDNAEIHGNSADYGGGIWLGANCVVTATNASDIHNNTATFAGGGARVLGKLVVEDSYISNNTALDGGGISVSGGVLILDSAALGSPYGGSQATGATGRGGGIHVYNSGVVTLTNNAYIADGHTAYDGAGIYADNATVYLQGANTSIQDSIAAHDGGGVYLTNNSALYSTDAIFNGNQAAQHGGAIAAYTSTLSIDADYVRCDPLANQCSAFYDNTADSDANGEGYGGGLYVYSSALQIDHTYLHHNNAASGGAIYQAGAGAAAQLANSLIYSNTVTAPTGAGIRIEGGAFTMTHTTLANNTGASAFSATGGTINTVRNSIAWDNSSGFTGTLAIAACNIDQSGIAGASLDPKFVAPGVGEDYHLQGSSPAVNACDTGLPRDLNDRARPSGSRYDMGAYELFQYSIYLPVVMRQ